MMGGGWHQAGVLAAAAMVALDDHLLQLPMVWMAYGVFVLLMGYGYGPYQPGMA